MKKLFINLLKAQFHVILPFLIIMNPYDAFSAGIGVNGPFIYRIPGDIGINDLNYDNGNWTYVGTIGYPSGFDWKQLYVDYGSKDYFYISFGAHAYGNQLITKINQQSSTYDNDKIFASIAFWAHPGVDPSSELMDRTIERVIYDGPDPQDPDGNDFTGYSCGFIIHPEAGHLYTQSFQVVIDFISQDDPSGTIGTATVMEYPFTFNVIPIPTDSDSDGLPDDQDNCPVDSNPDQADWPDADAIGDICDPDDDNDGMPDEYEIQYGLDPSDPSDTDLHSDGDGFSNLQEYLAGTDPNDSDSFPNLRYVITDLGTFGGIESSATDINDNGAVVGQYTIQVMEQDGLHNYTYGFHLSNGIFTKLGPFQGGETSRALGINDSGQVVGNARTADGEDHAFLYSNNVLSDLGTLGGDYSYAWDINKQGQIAGSSTTSQGSFDYRPFFFSEGSMTGIEPFPGNGTYAYAINDIGTIVGAHFLDSNTTHAFIYSNGALTDLNEQLANTTSFALDVNNAGQIVGSFNSTDGYKHVFIFADGVMRDITPTGQYFRGSARGINNAGQVVGSYSPNDGQTHPFIYHKGVTHDLETLLEMNPGWQNLSPEAINDKGQIVGEGMINGERHAFLASPIFIIPSIKVSLIPYEPDPTNDLTPTLQWYSVSGATSYKIQIDDSDAFTTTLLDESVVSGAAPLSGAYSYTPKFDLPEGDIYWRVSCDLDYEYFSDVDQFVITDSIADSDNDGMPDEWESRYGLDPSDSSDAGQDLDGDGFTNLQEFHHGTSPNDAQNSPVSPLAVASIDTPGIAWDVYVAGDHAFVTDKDRGLWCGLHVYDIGDPLNPSVFKSIEMPDYGDAKGIFVSGNYAFVTTNNGGSLQVIDASDPANAVEVGSVGTTWSSDTVYVQDRYAYTGAGGALHVIDVIDPSSPQILGSITPRGWNNRTVVSGNYAYIASGHGLEVIDVSNPAAPSVAASIDTPGDATGLCISGPYAYIAETRTTGIILGESYTGSIQVIDISDPLNPQIVGSLDLNDTGAWGVTAAGKHLYVAGRRSGLHVVDVSNPSAPMLVDTILLPGVSWNVFVSGCHAYVTSWEHGLQVVDLSNFGVGSKPFLLPYLPDPTPDFTPTVQWYGVSGAANYKIEIDDTGAFNPTMLLDEAAVSGPAGFSGPYRYTPKSVLPEGTIYWRVSSELDYEVFSDVDQFEIVGVAPSLIPYEPDPTLDATPTFQWYGVSGASFYRIEIDDSTDFAPTSLLRSAFVSGASNVSDPFSYTPWSALPPGPIYWRVSSDLNWGLYSAHDQFTIQTDSDGDEVPDDQDAFPNDPNEWADSDNDGIGDNTDSDDDNDSMPDVWETHYGLDPRFDDAGSHADADGYSNLEEYRNCTDPTDASDYPTAVLKGDLNGSGDVDLTDLILSLQVTAGISPAQSISNGADVNGDRKIGLEEAIHALQIVAELKSQIRDNGLLAFYPFNGNANDISGSGNNGTIHGADLIADRFGNPNSAFYFDGNDPEYITIPNNPSLSPDHLTLAAWINMEYSNNDSGLIIDNYSGSPHRGYDFFIDYSRGNLVFSLFKDGVGSSLQTNLNMALGEWIFVTATYDGSTLKLYKNGQTIAEKSYSGGYTPATGVPFTIGNASHDQSNTQHRFVGSIDEVRIYSRALSQAELESHYSSP